MKKTYILNGLGCANCAAKMEREINELEGIKNASLNFMTKKLVLETENQHHFEDIKRIINKIEPDVNIKEQNDHTFEYKSTNQKAQIIKIIISLVLLGFGIFLPVSGLIKTLLFFISYIIIGGEIVFGALLNIFKGNIFDENFLMSIATIGAFIIGEYPEGVAVMLFYQIGEFFQDYAVNRSRKEIAGLVDIRPEYANVQRNGSINKVSPDSVDINEIIIVKAGEKIPLDGIVTEGTSSIDTSALTGESLPKDVTPGDSVLGGCINTNGLLTIKVVKKYSESTVSKILELIESSGSKKAQTEKFITKFARYYTPAVVLFAFLLSIIPPVITHTPFSDWVYRALIFLVVSCPCALVISIPLGFFGGIGRASKAGVLVKGGNFLEILSKTETIVFDKTGTLTKGVFNVQDISTNMSSKEEFLRLTAHCESISNHPISKSILKAYGKETNDELVTFGEEIPGLGIKAVVDGKKVIAGNEKLMKKENIEYSYTNTLGTIIHVAIDGKYSGFITISDELKEDAENAISELKAKGIKRIAMLTGDNKAAADEAAKKLGISEVYAELLPDGKVEQIENMLKETSGKLMFVGDGINDAPVLARSDIGVAMGGLGSDAAIEVADIVIMTDEPSKISVAVNISNKTLLRVNQNIYFALGVKFLILILSAFGIATMWEAVFADVGVSLIAILNAIRK